MVFLFKAGPPKLVQAAAEIWAADCFGICSSGRRANFAGPELYMAPMHHLISPFKKLQAVAGPRMAKLSAKSGHAHN